MNSIERKRFEEFDIGRAVAILGLPIVHLLEEMANIGTLSMDVVYSNYFLLVLSAFGAPLFMTCLGANIVFSSKSTPALLAKRGLLLLFLGVLLNVMRFGIPDLIFGGMTGIYTYGDGDFISMIASSDIYDFAGLCFLTFALFKLLNLKPKHVLGIAVALLVIGAYVLPHFFADPEWTPLTAFLGRFFWMNEYSWFPLMTWLIFPACGYFFGSWYKQATEDERKAKMKVMVLTGGAALILTTCLVLLAGGDPILVYATPANSYITDIPCVIMQVGSLACAFPLLRALALLLQGTKALEKIIWLSSCIMPYYLVQWVIIGWICTAMFDLGYEDVVLISSNVVFWIACIAIVLASLLVVKGWDMLAKRSLSKRAL